MSDDRQKNDFKRKLENLIDSFRRGRHPTAPLPFLGAIQADPHEHDTRAEFLDVLMTNLGWPRGSANAKVIEEARIKKDDTTLFLDYLGVNPESRAPVIIVEAKAWPKPWIALSSAALSKEGSKTNYNDRTLVAAALDRIKGGENPSLVTAEWTSWLSKLVDYVRSVRNASGHMVKRVALTSGQWLVVFRNPENAFIDVKTEPSEIFVFTIDNYVGHSDIIFELLDYNALDPSPPDFIRASQLVSHLTHASVKYCFKGLYVMRNVRKGAHIVVKPQLFFYPAIIFERNDGGLVTVVDFDAERVLPDEADDLETHIANMESATAALTASVETELGGKIEFSGTERFPGFLERSFSNSDRGAAPIEQQKKLLKRIQTVSDEFVLVTGMQAHFLRSSPSVDSCANHSWASCKTQKQARGTAPIVSRSVDPISFFITGEDHHCAHQQVADHRLGKCQIALFEDYLCCRSCNLESYCWTSQESALLPCGSDTVG